jgi:hypothetical protein
MAICFMEILFRVTSFLVELVYDRYYPKLGCKTPSSLYFEFGCISSQRDAAQAV